MPIIIQCPILWYAKACALPSARSSFVIDRTLGSVLQNNLLCCSLKSVDYMRTNALVLFLLLLFLTDLSQMWNVFLFLIVAICALPVFRGSGLCPGLSAERPGLPYRAAALPERGAAPQPHVPHHQRLLSGEMERTKEIAANKYTNTTTVFIRSWQNVPCVFNECLCYSLGFSQCLVLVHSFSHSGHLSHRGNVCWLPRDIWETAPAGSCPLDGRKKAMKQK